MTTREQQKGKFWLTDKAIALLDSDQPIVIDNPKGADMVLSFHASHPARKSCGGCAKDIMRTGITSLVYTFETCSCDQAEYTHLVETPWHRSCLVKFETPKAKSS